jgi:hypothetical protein
MRKKKEKPINWKLVLIKSKEMQMIKKADEVKYLVRRLYELLF